MMSVVSSSVITLHSSLITCYLRSVPSGCEAICGGAVSSISLCFVIPGIQLYAHSSGGSGLSGRPFISSILAIACSDKFDFG